MRAEGEEGKGTRELRKAAQRMREEGKKVEEVEKHGRKKVEVEQERRKVDKGRKWEKYLGHAEGKLG